MPLPQPMAAPPPHLARIASQDWPSLEASLDTTGYAVIARLLEPDLCREIAAGYDDARQFRARVIMRRHGFGSGEYQYYAAPLPEPVASLRTHLYAPLAPLANRWAAALGGAHAFPHAFPLAHTAFTRQCHAAGQTKPTPLLLRYAPGDFNCLHQDLYGDLAFPLQVAILLSEPGTDFDGGEFVLTEQRPRMQSRADVVPLRQGDAVIFAVNQRPVAGSRGIYRVVMRHGVSRVRAGRRSTLGIIFHDAR